MKTFEFTSSLSPALRIVIFIAGLFPLIAPYELLMKPKWTTFASPFFLSGLLISLVAVGLSIGFLVAAVVGLNEVVRFNTVQRKVTYGFGAPFIKWRENHILFADIREVRVDTQTWESRPDTYRLRLDTTHTLGGRPIKFGNFATMEEAEKTQVEVRTVLGLS